jgi:PAS domain S-box-containing protein
MSNPEESKTRLEVLAAQLESIFEAAPLGIGLFDRQLRHVRVNPLLAEMNGQQASELIGRTPEEVHGAVGKEAERLYRSVMASGTPMRDVPLSGEIAGHPGELHHWRLHFFPIRHDGEVLGLCVLVEDVTEERRLTEKLAESEERHRRLSEDLQRSLVPPLLPRLAGAELASFYRPAMAGASVGGDFYDVMRISDSSWAMVIGDVQGKGPVAASWTAAVRYTIRAATVESAAPAHVLRIVNEVLMREESDDSLCTVGYLLAERQDGHIHLRSVSAGHPLPLVLRSSGELEPLGEHGTLLGTLPTLDLTEATATLADGDALVLYTDGVTDARLPAPDGHVDLFGEARLHAALRAARGANAAGISASVESAVMTFQAGHAADDLALVVLRVVTDPDSRR